MDQVQVPSFNIGPPPAAKGLAAVAPFEIERHTLTLGTDPEFFVGNQDGALLPAYTFLASKQAARPDSRGMKYFWDGFQAEMTTPVEECPQSLSHHIQHGLQRLLHAARRVTPNAHLLPLSTMEVPEATRQTAEERHVQLGCDPSLNIYGMGGRPAGSGRNLAHRFAGGHIHFGVKEAFQMNPEEDDSLREMVSMLDAVVGVWSVAALAKYESPIRRQYYGLAGEFRFQPWGFEWRTLSNAWLYHPALCNLTLDMARACVFAGRDGARKWWLSPEHEVIETVNGLDVERARAVLRANEQQFLALLKEAQPDAKRKKSVREAALTAALEGIDSVLGPLDNLEANWAKVEYLDDAGMDHPVWWQAAIEQGRAEGRVQ